MTVLVWTEDEATGMAALLTSVREARERMDDPDQLVIVGHGLAGVAAASLAIHQRRLGIRLRRVVCVAPDWTRPDPISGQLIEPPDREDVVIVESPEDVAQALRV